MKADDSQDFASEPEEEEEEEDLQSAVNDEEPYNASVNTSAMREDDDD